MARVVRKVSNKATKGQKREKGALLHSKKFWIIAISILVVLITAGIIIGVVIANNQKKDETVEVDDYFGKTYKVNDKDINFTKMTYQGVYLHTNPEEGELFNDYTFVFAANLATFYPEDLYDSDDNNLKDSKHYEIFEALKELQYEIDRYNSSDEPEHKIALYIVNTDQVDGNTSYNIYSDSKFTDSSDTDSESSLNCLFAVIDENGLIETKDSKDLHAASYYTNNKMVTSIGTARNMVKDYANIDKNIKYFGE